MDLTTKQWEKLPAMLESKYAFGAVSINHKIYICGGTTGTNKFDNLEVFDCKTNTWTALSPMQNGRTNHGMIIYNKKIVVSGSWGQGSDSADVEQYSPDTNTWTQLKSMNEVRCKHEMVNLNGEMFAIGGHNTKTVERYNPSKNEWHYVAPTHNIHIHSGAIAHNDKIYVLSNGGFEVYDPHSNVWQNLSKLSVGYGSRLVSINNKLWAIGGGSENNMSKATKSLFEYDITSNSWQKLPDMDVARRLHRSVIVKY